MRARLVGHDLGPEAAREQPGLHVGAVAEQSDRERFACGAGVLGPPQGLVDRRRLTIEVARLDPALDARRVDLDAEGHAAVHRDRERLGAAHPSETASERDRASERASEPLGGALRERLVRALQDPLGPDVDPRPRRHLAVHRETGVLELAERVPVRPLGDEHRVGDQDPWRHLVRAEDPDRLARLHQQRLVVAQIPERPRRSHRRHPRIAPRDRSRRRRRGPRGARRRRGRGCSSASATRPPVATSGSSARFPSAPAPLSCLYPPSASSSAPHIGHPSWAPSWPIPPSR